jgi:hypothetical protein
MSQFSEWLIQHHPRVTYLKKARQCAAMRHGAPLKVFWRKDGYRQRDESIIAPWRCKTPAHYKFTALKRSRFGTSGTYCLQHLYYREIFGEMTEMEATEKLMVSTGYATPQQTLTQDPDRGEGR